MENIKTIFEEFVKNPKPMNFIYGVNGTGKTTFSNIFDKNKSLIFNNSFTLENIYQPVLDEKNEYKLKISSDIKKKQAGFFIGNEQIILSKEIENMKEEVKKINYEISNIEKFNILNFRNNIQNDEEVSLILSEEWNKNYSVWLKNINLYKDDYSVDTKNVINYFHNLKNNLIKNNFIKNIESYNKTIFLFDLNNLEKLFKLINESEFINNKIISFLREGKEIHLEKDKCKFCDDGFITNERLEIINKLINNEIEKLKNDFILNLKKLNSETNYLLKYINEYEFLKSTYLEIYKKLNSSLILFEINLDIKQNLIEKVELWINFLKEKPTIDSNFLKIIDNKNINFEVNLLNKEYVKSFNEKTNIKNIKLESIKEKENLLKRLLEKTEVNDLQEILNKISSKRLRISKSTFKPSLTKSANTDSTVEISLEEKDIEKLSEGEVNELSLSFFFVNIRSIKKNKKTPPEFIVFDDPINSLDIHNILRFLNLLIKECASLLEYCKENKFPEPKLLILSHSISIIHYLLLDKYSKTKTSNEIKKSLEEKINVFKIIETNKNQYEMKRFNSFVDIFSSEQEFYEKYLNNLILKQDNESYITFCKIVYRFIEYLIFSLSFYGIQFKEKVDTLKKFKKEIDDDFKHKKYNPEDDYDFEKSINYILEIMNKPLLKNKDIKTKIKKDFFNLRESIKSKDFDLKNLDEALLIDEIGYSTYISPDDNDLNHTKIFRHHNSFLPTIVIGDYTKFIEKK